MCAYVYVLHYINSYKYIYICNRAMAQAVCRRALTV